MVDTLQFVDAISGSPTVLLDLNNNAPIYLAGNGWSAPPPPLSRAASNSSARDGTLIAQSAYADRELVLTFGLNTASQDAAAAAIQSLGRMLNSEGQWLKWQPGTTNPVFFRTKRAEIDALEEFNGIPADGFREITIRIPAAPFAYGLAETGTAVAIANDPTAGTNPMSYVFPTVKGDVPTPLVLGIGDPSALGTDMNLDVSVASLPTSSTLAAPQNIGTFSATATTGWTFSSDSNATWIGGSAFKATRASGSTTTNAITFDIPIVEPGDYRLMLRVQGTTAMSASVRLDPAATPITRTFPSTSIVWMDFGVFRVPLGWPYRMQRSVELLTGVVTTIPAAQFTMTLTVPSATFAIVDQAMLVPAKLDAADVSTYLKSGTEMNANTTDRFFVDGISERLYLRASTTFSSTASKAAAGGFPQVTPGRRNFLSFVRNVDGAFADVKTNGLTVDWYYYPQYLYARPAST